MTLDDSVRELAKEIKRTPTPPTRGTPGLPTLARQQGVVASISTGPPVTVTLTLGGSTVPIPGVRVIDGYNPTAGTTVTVLASADGDLLVIGGESGTSGGAAISWPLTFSGDMGFEPDGVANLALTLKNAPLAVNGVTLSGVISGAAPSIAATGSDPNIPLNLQTKGTGPLQINGVSGSATQVLTSNGASAAPTWQAAGGGVTWPLTNSGDETFQPNSVANSVLVLHNNASASTAVTITGTNAAGVTLAGSGVVSLYDSAAATGSVLLGGSVNPTTVGGAALTATGVASGVNGVTIIQSVTGFAPSISATGGDTNISLTLTTKGSGAVFLNGQTSTAQIVGPSTGLILGSNAAGGTAANIVLNLVAANSGNNYFTMVSSSGGNPALSIQGSSTNMDMVLAARGTGAIKTAYGWKTAVIPSGALPTTTFVSGIGKQILATRDIFINTPVTYTPTAGAAATLLVELSPNNVTYSTLSTETVPAGTALDSFIISTFLQVPAAWYVRLTATNATIGTATYW